MIGVLVAVGTIGEVQHGGELVAAVPDTVPDAGRHADDGRPTRSQTELIDPSEGPGARTRVVEHDCQRAPVHEESIGRAAMDVPGTGLTGFQHALEHLLDTDIVELPFAAKNLS